MFSAQEIKNVKRDCLLSKRPSSEDLPVNVPRNLRDSDIFPAHKALPAKEHPEKTSSRFGEMTCRGSGLPPHNQGLNLSGGLLCILEHVFRKFFVLLNEESRIPNLIQK